MAAAIPDTVHYYVSHNTGSDAAGTGSAASPFQTLEKAVAEIRASGYNDWARITVVDEVRVTAAALNLTVTGKGAQNSPLIIAGNARQTLTANEQKITAVQAQFEAAAPANCGSGLYMLTVDGPGLFVQAQHQGKLLRFTNQPDGSEVFIANVLSVSQVLIAVGQDDGSGFTPAVDDMVTVEEPTAKVVWSSPFTVLTGYRVAWYNLEVTTTAHQAAGVTLVQAPQSMALWTATIVKAQAGTNFRLIAAESDQLGGILLGPGSPEFLPTSQAGIALDNITAGNQSLVWQTSPSVRAPVVLNHSVVVGHDIQLQGAFRLSASAVVLSKAPAGEITGSTGPLNLLGNPADLRSVYIQVDDALNQPALFLAEGSLSKLDRVSIVAGSVSDASVGILHQAPGSLRITNTVVKLRGQRAFQGTDKTGIVNFYNLRLLPLANDGDIKEIACNLDGATFLGDQLVIRGAVQRGLHASNSKLHVNGGSISACQEGGITLDSQCSGKLLELHTDPEAKNGQWGLKLFGQSEISVSIPTVEVEGKQVPNDPLTGTDGDVLIGNNNTNTTWDSILHGTLQECSDFLVAAPPGTQLCKVLRMS